MEILIMDILDVLIKYLTSFGINHYSRIPTVITRQKLRGPLHRHLLLLELMTPTLSHHRQR